VASASVVFLLALLTADRASASSVVDEALARVFPSPGAVTKDTLYLTEEQAREAGALAGSPLPSKIVTRYIARGTNGVSGELLGVGYVETHLVRTLPETLLIVVDREGKVARVEVLAFREPREYLPSERWLGQFDGRELEPDLQLKRAIRSLSGATLSSRAVTEAVRRALAVHRLVGTEAGEAR